MYYAQFDLLERLSKGKKWSFAEVRPDGVVRIYRRPNPYRLLTPLTSPASCPLTMP